MSKYRIKSKYTSRSTKLRRRGHNIAYVFVFVSITVFGLVYFTLDPERDSSSMPQNSHTAFTSAKARLLWEDQRDITTRECSRKYGYDLIQNWRKAKTTVCSGFQNSAISCFINNEYRDNPRVFCTASNVGINVSSPTKVISQGHMKPLTINFTNNQPIQDVLTVDCNPMVVKLLSPWLWTPPQSLFMEHVNVVESLQCTTFVNHTVFWLQRYDYKNAFHVFEDVVTLFQSLLILDLEDPRDMELVIHDSFPTDNPLFDLYTQIFGKGVRVIEKNPFEEGTCFKNSIFGMWGDDSHLSHDGGVSRFTQCPSPILRALQHFLHVSAGIEHPSSLGTIYDKENELKGDLDELEQHEIGFISRKQYDHTRRIGRVLQNESQVKFFQYIRAILPSNWELKVYRPEDMSTFREQATSFQKLTILIGLHGAGLANTMFMREGSHLIEIFAGDRSPRNRHYYNFCKWLGINYHSPGYFLLGFEPEPILALISKIISEVEERDRRIKIRKMPTVQWYAKFTIF